MKQGFTALKFDPFGSAYRFFDAAEEKLSIAIVRAVRTAVGDDRAALGLAGVAVPKQVEGTDLSPHVGADVMYNPSEALTFQLTANPDFAQMHEGDWELVTVITDTTGKPLTVGYSRHCAGTRRDWAKVEKRPKQFKIDMIRCIYCGMCEEACPVDAIVETRLHEYHMENRGENIMTKDKLLAVGGRYEAMIAADKAADARYR